MGTLIRADKGRDKSMLSNFARKLVDRLLAEIISLQKSNTGLEKKNKKIQSSSDHANPQIADAIGQTHETRSSADTA